MSSVLKALIPLMLLIGAIVMPVYVRAEDDWSQSAIKAIDDLVNRIEDIMKYALMRVMELVIDIARIAYVLMAVLGFLFWASGYSTYTGRKMLLGALLLAIVVELLG
ncbi:MAG: hypothetical protein DRJ66_03205 [Thermoprotei archaeon]|nr:MAG: hypothetical protein DRJ66_03205 [Thermoprotei archaeon]RLF19544.1 MAG: hypothetical protein DRZ82_05265 [Thermoprotei archaeon]